MPTLAWHALIPYLRPRDTNYLSQESVLSERGLISQLMIDSLAVMTTGTSHQFDVPDGTIYFTKTTREFSTILDHTYVDTNTGLLVADEWLLNGDLRRAGRNVGLLDETVTRTS